MNWRPTHHAVERYRVFYPRAEGRDVAAAAIAGPELEPPIAYRLLGRGWAPRGGTVYRLHPERTGIFAIDPATETIVTFLRFYGSPQRGLAVRLFGHGSPPTARFDWNRQAEPEPEPEPEPDDAYKKAHPSDPLGPLVHFGAPWGRVSLTDAALQRLGGQRDQAKAWLFRNRCRPRHPGSPRFTHDERVRAMEAAAALPGAELVALCRAPDGAVLWAAVPEDSPGTIRLRVLD